MPAPVDQVAGQDEQRQRQEAEEVEALIEVTPILARVKSSTRLTPTTQKPMTRKIGTPITNRKVTAREIRR